MRWKIVWGNWRIQIFRRGGEDVEGARRFLDEAKRGVAEDVEGDGEEWKDEGLGMRD